MSASGPVRAAGGVVVDGGSEGVRLVVVHRPAYDDWSLPKGKCEDSESWETCALREVEEETGLRCRLLGPVGRTAYTDDGGRRKEVRWWLMRPVAGELRGQAEVDAARWIGPADALEVLSYELDRKLLEPLLKETRVWLVRHADAGDPARWRKPDRLRPLGGRGRKQARLLARALAGVGIERLVSSPYVRCLQTLEPLAAELGLPIEQIAELAEGHGLAGVEPLLMSGRAIAASTHGDILDEVLDELRAAGLAPPGARASKGSVWVLGAVAGVVQAAEYLPPPDG